MRVREVRCRLRPLTTAMLGCGVDHVGRGRRRRRAIATHRLGEAAVLARRARRPARRRWRAAGSKSSSAKLGATRSGRRGDAHRREDTEYGGWKRLGMALGHFAEIVAKNERDGVLHGRTATRPVRRCPGMVAGLQHSGPTREPIRVGMLWLDAHPDFNTPETTRSGSLGGMPVAVATGRALQGMRLDAQAGSAAVATSTSSWAACGSPIRSSSSCSTTRGSSS